MHMENIMIVGIIDDEFSTVIFILEVSWPHKIENVVIRCMLLFYGHFVARKLATKPTWLSLKKGQRSFGAKHYFFQKFQCLVFTGM